jgi:3-hydroxybutyryl-CoA dehydrogenase
VLTLGVVGVGLMGRAIASLAARAGCPVSLYDTDPAALERAAREVEDAGGGRVRAAAAMEEALQGVDLVVEAIVENLEAKQALFERLGALLPGAILATNTSVLPVTAIAARALDPSRVVGTHWWNPPHLIPVVEVVRGAATSDATMDATFDFLTRLGKTPVRVERDVPGFIGNRLQHALWREAIALVADGVCDAPTVDLMVRNTLGLRLGVMGPLENADYVGLDLTLAIHEAVLPSLNRDQTPSPLLRALTAEGRLGAKSGRGFLAWPQGERERTASRLADHVQRQLSDPRRRNAALSGRTPHA